MHWLLLLSMLVSAPGDLAAVVAESEAVEWELERRGLMAPDYGAWLKRARPEFRWDARHFRAMQRTLDDVTRGAVDRVVFQVPIRHGKSEHNTISYPVYRLEKDPAERMLVISHKDGQALKFSRQIRRLAAARGVEMSPERNAAGEWETVSGGGVTALGLGAGTASLNANLIIIDDPIGKRADAESEATREASWDALTNDVLARASPGTAVILTMSRWHMDDVVGRILDGRAGKWHLVDLPGLAEDKDPLGRKPGEPLWSRLGREFMDQKLAELGSYGFASLIQGRPSPRGGGMFKWDWWGLLDAVPAAGQMIRYWDTAGTDATGENDPDYTAGALGCRMEDARTAIVDMARFRLSVSKRDARISEIAKSDRERYGHRVKWWFESESGIAGKDRTASLVRAAQAHGIACYSEPATGKKEVRAEPLASAAEAGNVLLCPGEWRDVFRLEAAQFPTGAHDDQVDAASGMFNKLAAVKGPARSIPSPVGY